MKVREGLRAGESGSTENGTYGFIAAIGKFSLAVSVLGTARQNRRFTAPHNSSTAKNSFVFRYRRRVSCVFEFDLGAILKTRPYDKEGEQWLLYEPSHKVLSLRADGRYRYMRSDVPEDQGRWKPMQR